MIEEKSLYGQYKDEELEGDLHIFTL